MSGHSHWAGIKHKKALTDAKRAGVFTQYGRIVTLAAREGGGNPEANFKLRLAIDQARSVNMPKENIERAIKRGTGELKDQAEIEEIVYEGYLPTGKAGGPGQVAMLIKTATDNRNRTVGEIKSLFTKGGGKMVSSGSVSFLFQPVGEIILTLSNESEREQVELQSIEAGAQDIEALDKTTLAVYTRVEDLQKVEKMLRTAGVNIENASLAYRPTQTVSLNAEAQAHYEALLEKLNDHDDVQEIYDNVQ